jgi:hypothetical protein
MTTEQKLDKILDNQILHGEKIAVINKQLESLVEHDKRIVDLEKNQNRAVGALVIIGSLFTAFITWVFKKFE